MRRLWALGAALSAAFPAAAELDLSVARFLERAAQADAPAATAREPARPPAAGSRLIAVTGFASLAGHTGNSSGDAAIGLHGKDFGSYRVEAATLPVCYEGAREAVVRILREKKPAALIMFGAGSVAGLGRIELKASDERGGSACEGCGRVPRCAARGRNSSSPADGDIDNPAAAGLARALGQAGLALAASEGAGRWVCNSTHYYALKTAKEAGLETLVVFMHLPYAREHRAAAAGRSAPPLKEIRAFAELFLAKTAAYLESR